MKRTTEQLATSIHNITLAATQHSIEESDIACGIVGCQDCEEGEDNHPICYRSSGNCTAVYMLRDRLQSLVLD